MKTIELDHYQTQALRTAKRDPESYGPIGEIAERLSQEEAYTLLRKFDLSVFTHGLTGEAGEFADMIKKHLGHGHALDKEKAAKELGDVLWYLAVLADSLGYRLSEIAEMNVKKLRARYPNGFSSEASQQRTEEQVCGAPHFAEGQLYTCEACPHLPDDTHHYALRPSRPEGGGTHYGWPRDLGGGT